jgi:sugar O-acyltransferase (sialic acid O-acetyltransferase NeuD family)
MVVAELAELAGYERLDFYDDKFPNCKETGPWKIVGNSDTLLKNAKSYTSAIVAIGNNDIRLLKQNQLELVGASLATLIHPSAIVSIYSIVQPGSVVMANAVLGPFTCVGKAAIINTAAIVEHDCCLADGVHVSPGAALAGNVSVGKGTWIGLGANVIQSLSLGSNVTVAAGATVVSTISDNLKVAGLPAKPI